MKFKIDILNCQEFNIEENHFDQCPLITSSYTIIQNNAANKYGTAVLVKNDFNIENVKTDTLGGAIVF